MMAERIVFMIVPLVVLDARHMRRWIEARCAAEHKEVKLFSPYGADTAKTQLAETQRVAGTEQEEN
jgi:hypothetical protein